MPFEGIVALRRAASALQFDSPLAAALGFRFWQGAAGIVTIALVARWFSPDLQGCYYTFMSVVALQALSDLGLFVVIISVASHEWARLQLAPDGTLTGDAASLARLVSLARQLGLWYGAFGLGSGILVGFVGLWFFGATIPPSVEWRGPWLALVALSTLSFWTSPFVALLEGCNQVATVNRYRLGAAIAGSLCGWLAMALGLGLWALPATAGCLVGRDVLLLGIRYAPFFNALRASPRGRLHWRSEIWPMQWRLAAQGLSQFVSTQLFNPILMFYHGPAEAGRFGMTWAAVIGIQTVALAWIQTRVPRLGQLAALNDRGAFERLWQRSSIFAVIAVLGGGALLCSVLIALNYVSSPYAARLLPPAITAILIAGATASQTVQAFAAYFRAHKREMLTVVGVGSSVLAGGLGWGLGRLAGSSGVAIAYTVAMGIAASVAAAIWLQAVHRSHAAASPRVQLWR